MPWTDPEEPAVGQLGVSEPIETSFAEIAGLSGGRAWLTDWPISWPVRYRATFTSKVFECGSYENISRR